MGRVHCAVATFDKHLSKTALFLAPVPPEASANGALSVPPPPLLNVKVQLRPYNVHPCNGLNHNGAEVSLDFNKLVSKPTASKEAKDHSIYFRCRILPKFFLLGCAEPGPAYLPLPCGLEPRGRIGPDHTNPLSVVVEVDSPEEPPRDTLAVHREVGLFSDVNPGKGANRKGWFRAT